jgi:hypothetical protein
MILLLASAASLGCAPMAFALAEGQLKPAIDEQQGFDLSTQQAFEGAARPGLAIDGSETAQETAPNTKPDKPKDKAPGENGDSGPAPTNGNGAAAKPAAGTSGSNGAATGGATTPGTDTADQVPAQIIRDLSTLPAPVKAMREKMVEAAASGDIERLRPLMQNPLKPAQIMNGEAEDPIDTLKTFSGDPDGQEILAIILDILASGAARLEAGTPDEVYVWPYFVGKPLAQLSPPERVELLRIVTAGDLMGMEESGNYNFYRIGISPDGHWKFMVGGD